MKLEILIRPFPAVRTNSSTWTKRAVKYYEKMDELRDTVEKYIPDMVKYLITDNYKIEFIFKIPNSWSKKEKKKHLGKMHKATPDIDNLFKGFTDTIFYKLNGVNDCQVSVCNCIKKRGEEDMIIFYNLD